MGNTIINKELGFTEAMARDLLMKNKSHSLWNKHFRIWTLQDCQNLINGIDPGSDHKRHIRHQRVLVVFNDGKQQEFPSVKGVANKFKTTQSNISNILGGRKGTTKFLSIVKI